MCDTWNAWLNLIGLKMVNTVYILQLKTLLNLNKTFNKFVFLQQKLRDLLEKQKRQSDKFRKKVKR